jgi:hypothetical protein
MVLIMRIDLHALTPSRTLDPPGAHPAGAAIGIGRRRVDRPRHLRQLDAAADEVSGSGSSSSERRAVLLTARHQRPSARYGVDPGHPKAGNQ